jgi:hypothetical protein
MIVEERIDGVAAKSEETKNRQKGAHSTLFGSGDWSGGRSWEALDQV